MSLPVYLRADVEEHGCPNCRSKKTVRLRLYPDGAEEFQCIPGAPSGAYHQFIVVDKPKQIPRNVAEDEISIHSAVRQQMDEVKPRK